MIPEQDAQREARVIPDETVARINKFVGNLLNENKKHIPIDELTQEAGYLDNQLSLYPDKEVPTKDL